MVSITAPISTGAQLAALVRRFALVSALTILPEGRPKLAMAQVPDAGITQPEKVKADIFSRQFTLAADTDHTRIENLERFVDLIPSFVAAGGKHILLEQSAALENTWKDYRDGFITDDGMKLLIDNRLFYSSALLPESQQVYSGYLMLKIFQLAKKHGLEIHAQDQDPNATLQAEYGDIIKAISEAIKVHAEKGAEEGQRFWQRHAGDPDFIRRLAEYELKYANIRSETDRNVARVLKQRVGNEKVLAFYGANHDDEDNKLGSFLGKENVTLVPLIPSRATPHPMSYIRGLSENWRFYVHFVAEDQTYKLDGSRIGSCLEPARRGDITPCGDLLPKVKFDRSPP